MRPAASSAMISGVLASDIRLFYAAARYAAARRRAGHVCRRTARQPCRRRPASGDTWATMNPQDLQSYRRLDSRADARDALDQVLARTQRSLRLIDDRGEFYGFDRPRFAAALQALLRRSRDASATLVLHDTGFIERDCPRVVDLLRRYAPRLRILRSADTARHLNRGFVLADETVVLRRPHFDHPQTFVDFDEQGAAAAALLLEQIIGEAQPAAGLSVTGL